MKHFRFLSVLILLLAAAQGAHSQKTDSSGMRILETGPRIAATATDSVQKKKHNPRKATIRSAILPGWGQAYNRKYWKIPIVYAALGVTGFIFNYNRVQYNKVKFAYFAVINNDTAQMKLVAPELKPFVDERNTYALQTYRNEFRKDIDYSVLFFLFFWALNVVDATVDGHLKDFDVSNDLSLKIKPAISNLPNSVGLSLVLNIGKHPPKHSAFQMP